MLEPRSNFSVAVLGDRLMVIGGFNGTDVLGEVEQYNSATNRFLHLLIIGRATEPSCQVISASSWTRAPELLTARSALACVQVPRGEIF